jgi:hypothetical protein
MFLKLRNQIKTDLTYPGSPERPETDRETLLSILNDIEKTLGNPTHSPLVAS